MHEEEKYSPSIFHKQRERQFTISLAFFIVIFVISSGIFGWYLLQKGRIKSLEEQVTKISKQIETLETNNTKIKVYMLVEKNYAFLATYKKQGNIFQFIEEINKIENTFDIELSQIQYSHGNIAFQATANNTFRNKYIGGNTNTSTYAYQKISKFLEETRTNPEYVFSFDFVPTFVGQNTIEITLNGKLK